MPLRRTALMMLPVIAALSLGAASAEAQGRRAFSRTDANGDGKISLQEFVAARGRIFEQVDTNHDGVLTTEEVAAYQTRLENAAAGAMIRSGRARKEGGGQGARLAELTAAGPVTRAQWDAMMTRRFERLDVSHLGYLTMDQMRGKGRLAEPAAAPPTPMPAPAPRP